MSLIQRSKFQKIALRPGYIHLGKCRQPPEALPVGGMRPTTWSLSRRSAPEKKRHVAQRTVGGFDQQYPQFPQVAGNSAEILLRHLSVSKETLRLGFRHVVFLTCFASSEKSHCPQRKRHLRESPATIHKSASMRRERRSAGPRASSTHAAGTKRIGRCCFAAC